jgi:hypothetical protein
MKERTVVTTVIGLLAFVVVLFTGNTDLIYIGSTVLFFVLCIAYAAWCERL